MIASATRAFLDRPYEPLISELGWKGRVHWGLLRAANLPIRTLLHSRGYGAASRTLARILGPRTVSVRVLGQACLQVRLTDTYWLSYVLNQRLYERELFPFLDHLRAFRCGFVDGGANIGWWSLMAEKFFGWPCVAIEANGELLPILEAHRRINGARFRILHRILWRGDGNRLPFRFDPADHAAGHVELESDESSASPPAVGTVSLDRIIFEHLETAGFRPDLVIVKLDIEGAESMALDGAEKALAARDLLLLYEDHGRDLECSASAAMLARGLRIYLFEDTGRLRPMTDIRSVCAAKPLPERGYNFLAVNQGRLANSAVEAFIAK